MFQKLVSILNLSHKTMLIKLATAPVSKVDVVINSKRLPEMMEARRKASEGRTGGSGSYGDAS